MLKKRLFFLSQLLWQVLFFLTNTIWKDISKIPIWASRNDILDETRWLWLMDSYNGAIAIWITDSDRNAYNAYISSTKNSADLQRIGTLATSAYSMYGNLKSLYQFGNDKNRAKNRQMVVVTYGVSGTVK